MKGFATWLAEEEYTPVNLFSRLAKPKLPSRLLEVLGTEEVKRLLASCDPDTANGGRDLAIVTLFLDTGLRLSELVGLSLDDVHLQDGWLKVFGKGEKERIVPFGTRSTKVLSRYLSFYRPEDSDAVAFFVNSGGSAITQNTIKMLFTRLRIRAKVPRVHPHLLRHTFATTYLMAGGGRVLASGNTGTHDTGDDAKVRKPGEFARRHPAQAIFAYGPAFCAGNRPSFRRGTATVGPKGVNATGRDTQGLDALRAPCVVDGAPRPRGHRHVCSKETKKFRD